MVARFTLQNDMPCVPVVSAMSKKEVEHAALAP